MIECYKWIPKQNIEHVVYYHDLYYNNLDLVKVKFDTLEDLLKDADTKLFFNIALDKYGLVINKHTEIIDGELFKTYSIALLFCRNCMQVNKSLDFSNAQRYYIDNGTIDSVMKILKSHMKNEETIINEDYD